MTKADRPPILRSLSDRRSHAFCATEKPVGRISWEMAGIKIGVSNGPLIHTGHEDQVVVFELLRRLVQRGVYIKWIS